MKRLLMLNMNDDIITCDLSGENIRLFRSDFPIQAGLRSCITAGNTLYAVGAYSERVYCYRLPDFKLLHTYGCVGKYPFKIEAWENKLYIACADSDTVHMLSLKNGQPLASYHTGGYLTAMALSPYCCILCTANTRKIFLLSTDGLYLIKEMPLPLVPSCALYCTSRERFYICGTAEDGVKGLLCIFDREGELIQTVDTGNIPVDICLWGNTLLISCSGEDVLALHSVSDGKTMGWIKGPVMPDRLAVTADGRVYVSSQLEDCLQVIDMFSRKALFKIKTGHEPSELIFYGE